MKKIGFAALWVKDAAEAAAPHVRHIGITAGAVALLCVNTGAFGVLAAVALAIAGVYALTWLGVFISSLTIKGLGFSEVSLERMALA